MRNLLVCIIAALFLLSFCVGAKAQVTSKETGGLPAGAPNFYGRWQAVHPNDIHHGIVYGNNLPPLVPYLKSQGLTNAQIEQWSPFILQNYCDSSLQGQETKCFQVIDDNGYPDDNVDMTDSDVQTLIKWTKLGYPVDKALLYTSVFTADIELAQIVLPIVQKKCPAYTFATEDFTKINPYRTVNKCFLISADIFQVLTTHASLANSTPNSFKMTPVILNYEKDYTPNVGVTALVLAKCYKIGQWSALGGKQTAPVCDVVFDVSKWASEQTASQ